MSINVEKRAARFLSAAAVIAGILMTCFWMKSHKRSPDLNQVCQGYSQDLVITLYHLKAPNQRPNAALLFVGLANRDGLCDSLCNLLRHFQVLHRP